MPEATHPGPLTLPSVCEYRCTPVWKLPWRPLTWAPALFVPSAFAVLFAFFALFQTYTDPDAAEAWLVRILVFLAVLLLALVLAIPGWLAVRRPYRARRLVRSGHRVPVMVFYAGAGGHATGAIQSVAPVRFEGRRQPALLLVAGDGRMWQATLDGATYHAAGTRLGEGVSEYRGTPWVAPLQALADHQPQPGLDQVALASRWLPADPQAPGYERVRAALERVGQGSYPDPRFVGGPVPGELVLPRSGRRYQGGLILHRPAHAPAHSSLHLSGRHRFAGVEQLFFGSDPGSCRGAYLVGLAPL